MPTVPSADDIRDTAATILAGGMQSATVDGRSGTALNPLDLIKAADQLQARELMAASGSQKSGWGFCRIARGVPGGTRGPVSGDC
jgi:hypothetical protein